MSTPSTSRSPTSPDLQAASAAVALWQRHPSRFFRAVLGFEATPWQRRILARILRRLHRGRAGTVCVPTGHGIGKSRLAAGILVWLMTVAGPVIVPTTAPTWRQVQGILWREVRRLLAAARVPPADPPNQTSWENGPAFALGISTNDPSRFQGYHAPLVVVIVDEASGVEPGIWDAVRGVTTGPRDLVIALGNPTDPNSVFCTTIEKPGKHVDVVRVSSWEAANWNARQPERIPGIVSVEWCEARREEWGEDSAAYQSRVLGRTPTEGADTLIRLAWIERAMARWEDIAWGCDEYAQATGKPFTLADREAEEVVIGLDLARHGGDRIAWAVRQELDIVHVESWDFTDDGMKILDHTRALWARWKAKTIFLDATGLAGHFMADMLRRQKYRAVAVDFGAAAFDDKRFLNQRAEMWWALREDLRTTQMALPRNDALVKDLTSPKYLFDGKPERLKLESKEQIRTRRQKEGDGTAKSSTDLGDACVLARRRIGMVAPLAIPRQPPKADRHRGLNPPAAWDVA